MCWDSQRPKEAHTAPLQKQGNRVPPVSLVSIACSSTADCRWRAVSARKQGSRWKASGVEMSELNLPRQIAFRLFSVEKALCLLLLARDFLFFSAVNGYILSLVTCSYGLHTLTFLSPIFHADRSPHGFSYQIFLFPPSVSFLCGHLTPFVALMVLQVISMPQW